MIRDSAHCFYWLSKTTCLARITTADSTNNIEQATTPKNLFLTLIGNLVITLKC